MRIETSADVNYEKMLGKELTYWSAAVRRRMNVASKLLMLNAE